MNIFDSELVQAIGWTLLHSIWQYTAIAIFALLFLVIYQNSKSYIRYMIIMIAMAIMIVSSVVTFILFSNAGVNENNQRITQNKELVVDNSGQSSEKSILNKTLTFTWFKAFFTRYMPLIVSIWFFGILLLTCRLMTSFMFTSRLKGGTKIEVPIKWINKLTGLSSKLKLNKKVLLFESALIKVPSVIGFFKPIIFLPVSTFFNLNSEQINMILLHELAHIKRNDYLVNLIQTFFDILFFFNPAFKWISQQSRIERELCCDQMVIDVTGDAMTYAQTLALMEEKTININLTKTVMAITGNNKSLSYRIKRMFNKEEKIRFRSTNIFISVIVLLIISGGLFSQSLKFMEEDAFEDAINNMIKTSTKDTIAYNFKEKGFFFDKHIELKFVDENMVYLNISGKEIKPDKFNKYYDSMILMKRKYEESIKTIDFHRNKINDITEAVNELKRELILADLFISNENYDKKKHCSIKLTNDILYINEIKIDDVLFLKISPLVKRINVIDTNEPLVFFEN